MKKLYTLAFSALLCGSAFAEGRQPIAKTLDKIASPVENTSEMYLPGALKAPAQASALATASDLAGTYTWNCQNLLNSNNPDGTMLTLEIKNALTGEATISGFAQNYVVKATVDVANGTISIPSQQDLGPDSYGDTNYFYLKDVSGSSVVPGLGSKPASIGTIEGNTVTFPNLDVWAIGDYTNENLGWWTLTYTNVLTKVDVDYSVAIDMADCADDDEFTFSVNAGPKATNLVYFLTKGMYEPSQANLDVVAAKGTELPSTEDLSLSAGAFGRGGYTLFVAALDESGNAKAGDSRVFYVYADDAENWTTLEGEAVYSEDLINSLYNNSSVNDYNLAVQVNNDTPGYFRLVNPYGEAYPKASKNKHEATHTHNHYLYINASDPEKVVVEFSPLAIDFGDGSMYANSMVNYLLDRGATEADVADYYGKYDTATRTITVPAKSLIIGESGYEYGSPGLGNSNNLFKVVLPESAGVDDIISDSNADAPVEYFNLQGVRVANPAAGQLVIKRQGSEVTKMVVR